MAVYLRPMHAIPLDLDLDLLRYEHYERIGKRAHTLRGEAVSFFLFFFFFFFFFFLFFCNRCTTVGTHIARNFLTAGRVQVLQPPVANIEYGIRT